jgi:anthranilate phosphoribosyltransferase
MVAGKAADLKQGAALAIQSIDSGKAKAALATLKRICA